MTSYLDRYPRVLYYLGSIIRNFILSTFGGMVTTLNHNSSLLGAKARDILSGELLCTFAWIIRLVQAVLNSSNL